MGDPREAYGPGDGLLLVDVQVDFCPGGGLPIQDGDGVVPVLNRWIRAAQALGVPIYASRDWHPRGHPSFRERGGEWPTHCIQDSPGADFHPRLELPQEALCIVKGTRFDRDQLSAFDETGLAQQLRHDAVKRLWVGGLAQDVCVLHTVRDALALGFEVRLIVDGTRPVTRQGGRRALDEMRAAGARLEVGG